MFVSPFSTTPERNYRNISAAFKNQDPRFVKLEVQQDKTAVLITHYMKLSILLTL